MPEIICRELPQHCREQKQADQSGFQNEVAKAAMHKIEFAKMIGKDVLVAGKGAPRAQSGQPVMAYASCRSQQFVKSIFRFNIFFRRNIVDKGRDEIAVAVAAVLKALLEKYKRSRQQDSGRQ